MTPMIYFFNEHGRLVAAVHNTPPCAPATKRFFDDKGRCIAVVHG